MAKKVNKEVEAEVVATPKASKKVEYPEVAANGRFQAVAVGEGFVVYNQFGQRATGVVSDAESKDLVTKNNIGASIK